MMEKLTAKLGPLPVWAWGVIIGVLLLAFVWFNKAGGTSSGDTTSDTTEAEASPAYPSSSNAGGDTSSYDGGTTTDTTSSTNAYWLTQGSAYAVSAGYAPTTAYGALQKYLSGADLSVDEGKIVDAVIRKLGAPPEGTTGVSTIAKPAATTPTTTTPAPPTSYMTSLKITAPSSIKYKTAFTVNATVTPQSHPAGNTVVGSGTVTLSRAGKVLGRGSVQSGHAAILIPKTAITGDSDGVLTLNAVYTPAAGTKWRSSSYSLNVNGHK